MSNSHLAAQSFFSGLIIGLGMERKEIPVPFHLSDLLKHPINSTNHHFHNIVVVVSCVDYTGCWVLYTQEVQL